MAIGDINITYVMWKACHLLFFCTLSFILIHSTKIQENGPIGISTFLYDNLLSFTIIGERARHSQVCSIENRDIYIYVCVCVL